MSKSFLDLVAEEPTEVEKVPPKPKTVIPSKPARLTATEIIELVQNYIRASPEDPLVQKVVRHLPANPEWNGTLKTGGGWSGACKDFARLLEKALSK